MPETTEEVLRLEGAVVALGQESLFAKFLFDALKAAKAKLNVPVAERLEACKKFLK